MNLTSPGFEKRFRALYRRELTQSPGWRKEVRRSKRPKQLGSEATGQALIWILIVVGIFANKATHGMNFEFALAIIALWAAGAAFLRADRYFETFYGSPSLVTLSFLPLGDADIFRVLWRGYWRRFGLIFVEVALLYLVLAVQQRRLEVVYLGVAAAVVQTLLILALALHAAVFLRGVPLGALGGLFRLMAIALVIGWPKIAEHTDKVVAFGRWFFPTGWLNQAFAEAVLRKETLALGLLIPIAALIYGARYSWARLRAFYSLDGIEIVPSSEAAGLGSQEGARKGATDIADALEGRYFLAGLDWARAGWLERLVSRFFRGRDRLVLEFLVAENPRWSQSFRTGLWLWGLGAVAVWSFGNSMGPAVYLPAYLFAALVFPLLGGEWRGLQGFPTGGAILPAYAVFPISFSDISRTLAKVNIIRICAAAPLLVGFGMFAAWRLNHPWHDGAAVSLKLLLLMLALQPVVNLLPISKATNDTTRMKALWGLVFLPVALALVALSFFFFVLDAGQGAVGIFGIIALLSVATFAIYRRAFRRGKFDLLARRTGGMGG